MIFLGVCDGKVAISGHGVDWVWVPRQDLEMILDSVGMFGTRKLDLRTIWWSTETPELNKISTFSSRIEKVTTDLQ